MNTSFNQFQGISYSWLGFTPNIEPAHPVPKESRFCSHCGVHSGAVMAFCTRCGGMVRRAGSAETPHAGIAPHAAAEPVHASSAPVPMRAAMPATATASRTTRALTIGAWLAILVGVAACGSYVNAIRDEAVAVERIAVEERGIIDSYADQLPASLSTVAGELVRATNADGKRHVTLNGKPLSTGDEAHWQFPVRVFDLPNERQAILMASSGGYGFNCETRFFFLVADKKGVQPTPLFGTCAPRMTFRSHGDTITFLLPRIGGLSTVEFKDGKLIEDGKLVALSEANDPFKSIATAWMQSGDPVNAAP